MSKRNTHGSMMMNRAFKVLQHVIRDDRGAIVVFVAIIASLLVTGTGVAYEMSKYSKAKSRFNNAVDQALLAAAAANPADMQTYATNYFKTNMAESGLEDVTVTKFSVSTNNTKTEWNAEAAASMKTVFGEFVGVGNLSLTHTAKVAWDTTVMTEMVAMVDVSGTMCANFERTQQQDGSTVIDFVPDRSCTKLNQMKESLKNIATIGVGIPPDGVPSYAVGIVPYTYKLALPNPAAVPAELVNVEKDAGYGDNYYTSTADAEGSGPPLPKVLPLQYILNESDKSSFIKSIEGLSTTDNQEFGRPFMKRSSLGALFSAYMLDPDYNRIFGGVNPRPFGTPKTRKIVIMMTDSANLGCCFTNWPETNFRNHYIYSYKSDHDALLRDDGQKSICDSMKDQGIEVFTLLLDVDRRDMDARGHEIVDAYRACASGPDHAFEVPRDDKQKLKEAYNIIGKSIMQLRLVE